MSTIQMLPTWFRFKTTSSQAVLRALRMQPRVRSGIMETNTVTEADSSVVFASTTAGEDNYLRLKAGSPAINVGNNDYVNNASPVITTDIVGAVRIRRGRVDLGAYESDHKGKQVISFTLATTTLPAGDTIGLMATTNAGLPSNFCHHQRVVARQFGGNNGSGGNPV